MGSDADDADYGSDNDEGAHECNGESEGDADADAVTTDDEDDEN